MTDSISKKAYKADKFQHIVAELASLDEDLTNCEHSSIKLKEKAMIEAQSFIEKSIQYGMGYRKKMSSVLDNMQSKSK